MTTKKLNIYMEIDKLLQAKIEVLKKENKNKDYINGVIEARKEIFNNYYRKFNLQTNEKKLD